MYALFITVTLIVPTSLSDLAITTTGCGGQCRRGTYCSESANYCKCQPGLIHRKEENGSFTCDTDINECELGIYDCPPNSSCVNFFGSYRCHCDHGLYTDKKGYCKPDVDECQLGTAECPQNTECMNTPGSYMCTCSPGFSLDVNGTCVAEAGISIAWYWWVGCAVLGGLLVICGLCKLINRTYDSDTDSDLGKEVLMELKVEPPQVTFDPGKESEPLVASNTSTTSSTEEKQPDECVAQGVAENHESHEHDVDGNHESHDNVERDMDGQPSKPHNTGEDDGAVDMERNTQPNGELTQNVPQPCQVTTESAPVRGNTRQETVIIEPVPLAFKDSTTDSELVPLDSTPGNATSESMSGSIYQKNRTSDHTDSQEGNWTTEPVPVDNNRENSVCV